MILQTLAGVGQRKPQPDQLLGKRAAMEGPSEDTNGVSKPTDDTDPPLDVDENSNELPTILPPPKPDLTDTNGLPNRPDLPPETIFANELALETAKTVGKEMFDFEFLFNQSDNYKESYYRRKFGCAAGDFEQLILQIKKSYIAGIIWNYRYYYKGCTSWNWFYPYYYAPLISDLCNFSCLPFQFTQAAPLRPFEQLLAVLPPYSAHALPTCFRELMEEETSTIVDFYPVDFHVDLAGKRFAWLGEVILPFIEDHRLKKAFAMVEGKLTPAERARNSLGSNYLFFVEDRTPLQGRTKPIPIHQAFSLSHYLSGIVSDTKKVQTFEYAAPEYVPHQSTLLNGLRLQRSDFYYTVGSSGKDARVRPGTVTGRVDRGRRKHDLLLEGRTPARPANYVVSQNGCGGWSVGGWEGAVGGAALAEDDDGGVWREGR